MLSVRKLMVIGVFSFLAGFGGAFAMSRFADTGETVSGDPNAAAREEDARQKAQREQAARERARARAEREKAARERAGKERSEGERLARKQALQKARNKEEREQVEREQATLDGAAAERLARERAVREQAERERAAREAAQAEAIRSGRAKLLASEKAAIATLRSIASAQRQLQAAAAVDTNADGRGEYGFLAELAGVAPLRVFGGDGPVVGVHALTPAVLATVFGAVKDDGSGDGAIERTGYLFKVYLPGPGAAGVAEAMEGGGKGVTIEIDADKAARLWCAYAWPVETGETGQRAFFINQSGVVLQHDNRTRLFTGGRATPFYSDAYTARSMDSPTAETSGELARFVWTTLE